MGNKLKKWSEDEIDFLKNNFENMLYKDISEKLNRSEGAIRAKCHDLNLVQKDEWNQDDITFLKDNYQIMPVSELAQILNRTINAIRMKAGKLGLKKYPYNCDVTFFDNIDTEEKAYWLGFLAADGWVSKNNKTNAGVVGCELQYGDIDHLRKFNKSIHGNYKIADRWRKCTISTRDTTTHECCLRIYSLYMYNSLSRLGFAGAKTTEISMPEIPKDLVRHYIRGYFDGDGCFALTSKSFGVSFISASDHLLRDIEKQLEKYDLFFYRSDYVSSYGTNVYRIWLYKKQDKLKLLDFMYKDSSIYLDRKFQKYLKAKEKYATIDSRECLAS